MTETECESNSSRICDSHQQHDALDQSENKKIETKHDNTVIAPHDNEEHDYLDDKNNASDESIQVEGKISRKFSEKYGSFLSPVPTECRAKNIYDQEGYLYIINRAKKSKELQDFLEKAFAEKAKLNANYSVNTKTWIRHIEDAIGKLAPFEHECELLNMILMRERRMCEARDSAVNSLTRVSKSFRRKTESLFGDFALGGLDNVHNIANKFKMAQKNWFKSLKELHEVRRAYLDQCIQHEKLLDKRNSVIEKKSNEQDVNTTKTLERLEQSRIEKNVLKDKYESVFEDVEKERIQYINDIQEIFQNYLNIEKSRFIFNRDRAIDYINIGIDFCLAAHNQSFNNEIFEQINQIDPEKDLRALSDNFGPTSSLKIPVKEDIEKKLQDIKIRSGSANSVQSIDGTSVVPGTLHGRKSMANLKRQISEEMGKNFETTEIDPKVDLDFEIATNRAASTSTPHHHFKGKHDRHDNDDNGKVDDEPLVA